MTKKQVSVWMIVWQHPQGWWYPWEFVNARNKRNDLYKELRECRSKHPEDTFRIRKFVMVES